MKAVMIVLFVVVCIVGAFFGSAVGYMLAGKFGALVHALSL
ncbi:hypothetical protein [Paraburkholderia sp. BL10I2N1]|nr:hypothetical protein [Paraburkholderia sp. BL10I2N1]TDN70430.1 hypothetical protein B0G77_3904 [Paraburkholderia sp. BL10I2N1]